MKKLFLIGLSAAALLMACKKSPVIVGNGCISLASPKYVTGPDSVAATALFKSNNIDYTSLRYTSIVLRDTLKNTTGNQVLNMVFAVKYYNGLPDLTNDYDYNFINGVYQSVWPSAVPAAINVPPVANLTLQNVRQSFINAAANRVNKNVADSCLVAQFGYYNLNFGTGNTTPNYVTAWYVTPAHSFYPEAIILDADGSAIYFIPEGPVLL